MPANLTCLLQRPDAVLLDDLDGSIFVQRSPPGLKDGSCGNGVFECGQWARIELVKCDLALVEQVDGVDELLERDVAVADLAGEVAFLVRRVLHVETGQSLARLIQLDSRQDTYGLYQRRPVSSSVTS
jgi:hypothetical protein